MVFRNGGAPWRARLAWLVFAVALAVTVAAVPAPAHAGQGATVTAGALNLRAEPGTWSWVITQVGYGEWVEIVSGPTDEGWYEVHYAGVDGWVYGGYLTLDGAGGGWDGWGSRGGWTDPWTSAGTGGYTAWVTASSLNVRAWAGFEATVLGTVWQGNPVVVTGDAVDGYLPIDYFGGRGWVWSAYLGFDGAPAERWIDIDRSSQTVTLYEGGTPVASYWGAMGFDPSADGFFATANGTFYVYAKHEGLAWTAWGQAFITDWVAFDPARSNGFHSFSLDWLGNVLPWGDGPSGGCVALAPWAADHVYAFADLGTRVEVHW